MSLNKINSENYESFYLDYLEGNLEQNDVLELFAFLNENPEFQVEEDLVVLEPKEDILGDDFKNLLKTDMLSQDVSLNNVDFFLLAQKEGQLSEAQTSALNQFLEANPAFKLDQKIYGLTSLKADTSIVYSEKSKLKQRATIVLWPYFSALAAACAILFFWVMPNPGTLDAESVARDLQHKTRIINNTNVAKENKENVFMDDQKKDGPRFQPQRSIDLKSLKKLEPQNKEEQLANQEKPKVKTDKPIKIKTIDEQPLENNVAVVLPNEKNNGNNNTGITAQKSSVGLSMKDVAPPVTRKLSEIIKTEVNLKKGEDANGERKGVYFKLGNFEFYRNRRVKGQ